MNTFTKKIIVNRIDNRVKTLLTLSLTLTLATIGLMTTLTQALPAIQIIQTPEIEEINIDSKKDIKETINQLNLVDPQKPTITKLEKKSKGEVTSNNNNIKVSIKSDKTISMDNGRNKISLKADSHGEKANNNQNSNSDTKTKLVDNKIIYEGTKVDTIVEAIDGGIRQTINIKDPTAPKVYNFLMELKQGEIIRINPDGSANVLNSKNELITTILKPWAKDATGKDIKTFYTVDKNVLQQHIETNSMTKYPVKADPTWCGNFWNDVGWVTEHDIYQNRRYNQIVRVSPSWCLDMISKATSLYGNPWLASDSWRELLDRLPANNNAWPNRAYGTEVYWSLHNQMACHITWIKWANAVGMASSYIQRNNPIYRNSYHLEAYRPNYGYWGFMNRLCNEGKIVNY